MFRDVLVLFYNLFAGPTGVNAPAAPSALAMWLWNITKSPPQARPEPGRQPISFIVELNYLG
jgi:hypothetical protein